MKKYTLKTEKNGIIHFLTIYLYVQIDFGFQVIFPERKVKSNLCRNVDISMLSSTAYADLFPRNYKIS